MTDLDHELAVLRPKAGDVVLLYVDLHTVADVDSLWGLQQAVQGAGARFAILPTGASAVRLEAGSRDVQGMPARVDDWLRPLGLRAVPLTDAVRHGRG